MRISGKREVNEVLSCKRIVIWDSGGMKENQEFHRLDQLVSLSLLGLISRKLDKGFSHTFSQLPKQIAEFHGGKFSTSTFS